MTIELKTLFDLEGLELNEKMVMTLLKAIKDGHQEGFDFLKFKQSVIALQAMNMDEATSVRSAYSTAHTLGITKDSLLKSAQHYQNLVDKERDHFASALKNQIANQVDQPLLDKDNTTNKIAENQRKIEQLAKENEALKQRLANIDHEIESAKEKIEKTRAEFVTVYQTFSNSITNDKNLYNNIL